MINTKVSYMEMICLKFKIRPKRIILSILIIVILLLGTSMAYIFCHSTPQMAIRTELFGEGHFISAFTTHIHKIGVDSDYGQFYACRKPAVGADHYAFIKKNGFWYINWQGTGGG